MDPYTSNGGSGAQPQSQSQQPPYNDPNPTRYIPPQEVPRSEVPGGEAFQPSGQQASPNPTGAPNSDQYYNQNTVPYSVNPAQRRDRESRIVLEANDLIRKPVDLFGVYPRP